MSFDIMKTVWEYTTHLEANERLVMLALADWADEGGLSWHSRAAIARRSGVSESTARRCLKTLAVLGYLRIQMGGQDGKTTSRYWVLVERIVGGVTVTPEGAQTEGGSQQGQEGCPAEPEGGSTGDTRITNITTKEEITLFSNASASVHASIPAPTRELVTLPSAKTQFEPMGLKPATALGTQVPDAFMLAEPGWQWALTAGWRGDRVWLQTQLDECVDYYKNKQSRELDWQARVRRWVRNQIAWGKDLAPANKGITNGQTNGTPDGRRTGVGWDKSGNPTNKSTNYLRTAELLAEKWRERANGVVAEDRGNVVSLSDDDWREC